MAIDLLRDPRERRPREPGSSARARALKQAAEVSVSPAAYRHRVRVGGRTRYGCGPPGFVPTLVIRDKIGIVGFREEEIREALRG